MKKAAILATSALSILLFTATSQAEETTTSVATVNGQIITQSDLQSYAVQRAQRSRTKPGETPREILIEELVNLELLYQEAQQKGLEKQPEVATLLNRMKREALSMAAVNDFAKNVSVTDAEMKEIYTSQISKTSITEYKARHILLKAKEEALAVIKQLKDGGDFATIAKEKSTGPTAKNGGDLGWFLPNRMVPAFAQAVVGMKNSEYTKEAVQTQFGWHVILREDSRISPPPEFETVKGQLEGMIKQQKIREHIGELRKTAKITVAKKEEVANK